MALVLTKGETLDLTKTDNSLTKLRVGLILQTQVQRLI